MVLYSRPPPWGREKAGVHNPVLSFLLLLFIPFDLDMDRMRTVSCADISNVESLFCLDIREREWVGDGSSTLIVSYRWQSMVSLGTQYSGCSTPWNTNRKKEGYLSLYDGESALLRLCDPS